MASRLALITLGKSDVPRLANAIGVGSREQGAMGFVGRADQDLARAGDPRMEIV